MNKKIVTKSAIRRMVTQLITRENNEDFNSFVGLNIDHYIGYGQNQRRAIRLLWLLFLGFCFAGSGYQIIDRVNYFLSDPMAVDVSTEIMSEHDVFKLTICSEFILTSVKRLQRRFKTKHHLDIFLRGLKVNVHQFWRMGNSTKWIDKAYFSMVPYGKKYVNASIGTVSGEKGPCTRIYYGKSLPIDDPSLKLSLKFNTNSSVNLYVSHRATGSLHQNLGALRYQLNSEIQKEIRLTLENHKLLNKKDFKCVTRKESLACEMKCQSDWINNRTKNCSVPFVRFANKPNAPSCSMTAEIFDIVSIINNKDGQEIYGKCKCPPSCDITMYNAWTDLIATGKIEVKLQSNLVRNLIERRLYSVISFLCDIGGTLSLFFGLSCVTFVEIILRRIQRLVFKKSEKKLVTNPLCRESTRVFEKYKLRISTSPVPKIQRSKIFARLFHFIIFVLCICQIYERIAHYFSYPIHTTVEFIMSTEKSFYVVSCLGSVELLNMMDEFSAKRNISVEKLDILDLLDEPSLFADAGDLWRMSSDYKHYLQGTPFITPFGNCTRHSSTAIGININRASCTVKHFFEHFDKRSVSYKEHIILQCNHIHLLPYTIKKIVRVNSSRKPCMSNEDAEYCEQQCYQSALRKKNITCGLPFMTPIKFPYCNTTKSAKSSKYAYLDAYENTDPSKECDCHHRCIEWIYLPKQSDLGIKLRKHTGIIYLLESDFHEGIIQVLSFPIEKLLCDIGSNLGSIAGVSALSLFESVHYSYRNTKMKRFW